MRIWIWLLATAHADVSVQPSPPPSGSALELIDHACRLIAAKKYNSKAFQVQMGTDLTRMLPPQSLFGGQERARFVPRSPAFSELSVSTDWVDQELFNQVTLTVAPGVRLTVGELRKQFPSRPRFHIIEDAFDIESLILSRKVPGFRAECELVLTVPRTRGKLDQVRVEHLTLQE